MRELTKNDVARREHLVAAYEKAVTDLNEWREGIVERMQAYYGDRTDKWRECEAGEAYDTWLQAWDEEFDADELVSTVEALPESVHDA